MHCHSKKNTRSATSMTQLKYSSVVRTWWAQRMSAIAMVPLVAWLVLQILLLATTQNRVEAIKIIGSPTNTILFGIFMLLGLYHGMLGVKEIVEDYVHCNRAKFLVNLLLKAVTYFTMITITISVISFHATIFGERIADVIELIK